MIWVDDKPVVLAEGDVPIHREPALAGTRMTGADVTQLQQFLVSQGYDDEGRLHVDGEFGTTTRDAVKDWQAASGLPETGRVDASQLVFSPAPSTAGVGRSCRHVVRGADGHRGDRHGHDRHEHP